jgi:hypothetical protein
MPGFQQPDSPPFSTRQRATGGVLGEDQPQEPLTDTWLLDFDTLQPAGIKQVIIAIERLGKGEAITRGRVIAGVPFGFWTGLFNRRYEELWRQRLRQAFPHGSLTRVELATSLGRIRRFRNRVAHHDCLLSQDVGGLIGEMLQIVGWIDPQACAWLGGRVRVLALLDRWPGARYACSATGTKPAPAGSSR